MFWRRLIPVLAFAGPAVVAAPNTPVEDCGEPSTVHLVQVGQHSDQFEPNCLAAKVGDIVQFQFHQPDHSVIQSPCGWPCVPMGTVNPQEDYFYSGSCSSESSGTIRSWNLTINDTSPIFYYSGAPGACSQYGMVGAINADCGATLSSQIALAKAEAYSLEPGEELCAEASASLNSQAAQVSCAATGKTTGLNPGPTPSTTSPSITTPGPGTALTSEGPGGPSSPSNPLIFGTTVLSGVSSPSTTDGPATSPGVPLSSGTGTTVLPGVSSPSTTDGPATSPGVPLSSGTGTTVLPGASSPSTTDGPATSLGVPSSSDGVGSTVLSGVSSTETGTTILPGVSSALTTGPATSLGSSSSGTGTTVLPGVSSLLTTGITTSLGDSSPTTSLPSTSTTATPVVAVQAGSGTPESIGGPPQRSDSRHLSSGAIAGIVVGVVVAFALIGILLWFCCWARRKNSRDAASQGQPPHQPDPENGPALPPGPIAPPMVSNTSYLPPVIPAVNPFQTPSVSSRGGSIREAVGVQHRDSEAVETRSTHTTVPYNASERSYSASSGYGLLVPLKSSDPQPVPWGPEELVAGACVTCGLRHSQIHESGATHVCEHSTESLVPIVIRHGAEREFESGDTLQVEFSGASQISSESKHAVTSRSVETSRFVDSSETGYTYSQTFESGQVPDNNQPETFEHTFYRTTGSGQIPTTNRREAVQRTSSLTLGSQQNQGVNRLEGSEITLSRTLESKQVSDNNQPEASGRTFSRTVESVQIPKLNRRDASHFVSSHTFGSPQNQGVNQPAGSGIAFSRTGESKQWSETSQREPSGYNSYQTIQSRQISKPMPLEVSEFASSRTTESQQTSESTTREVFEYTSSQTPESRQISAYGTVEVSTNESVEGTERTLPERHEILYPGTPLLDSLEPKNVGGHDITFVEIPKLGFSEKPEMRMVTTRELRSADTPATEVAEMGFLRTHGFPSPSSDASASTSASPEIRFSGASGYMSSSESGYGYSERHLSSSFTTYDQISSDTYEIVDAETPGSETSDREISRMRGFRSVAGVGLPVFEETSTGDADFRSTVTSKQGTWGSSGLRSVQTMNRGFSASSEVSRVKTSTFSSGETSFSEEEIVSTGSETGRILQMPDWTLHTDSKN